MADSPHRFVGIDVGARDVVVVVLEEGDPPTVVLAEAVSAAELAAVGHLCTDATVVAIDAPASLSTKPHEGDDRLPAKFRSARCGEIALRNAGIAVPFVTPDRSSDVPGWMRTGFAAWSEASRGGANCVETYPHGIFWRLAGRPLLHKQRQTGRAERRSSIASVVDLPPGSGFWSHNALDACAAAYLAMLVGHDQAQGFGCFGDESWPVHDPSTIWLPRLRSA